MTKGERLAGQVAVVFGGGGGDDGVSNGQATAMTYAREGAAVAVVDLDPSAARHTAEAISDEGGAAVALTADVTDGDQVADAARQAADALGPPDVLHNNVGAAVLGDPVELSYEQWRRAFALNVDSVFLTCKHVLPAMLQRGKGAIVNVSSVAGLRHVGYAYPAYMSAKAAVNQVTVSLALTYAARGIRANAVAPGFIDTPLVRHQLASQAGLGREVARRAARAEPHRTYGNAVGRRQREPVPRLWRGRLRQRRLPARRRRPLHELRRPGGVSVQQG